MEEIQVLAALIQHADQQIDKAVNFFMTLLGVIAVFTMTETYSKHWNWFLKLMLSAALTVILWNNRDGIIEQIHIYNALIADFPDDIEPWATLFGAHGVYQKVDTVMLWWVHAVASWLIHLMVWSRELNSFAAKRKQWLMTWWRNRKAKRRQLTGK